MHAQGKLFRAIEEKIVDRIGGRVPVPVDVRIVAATNRNLQGAAEAGEFRRDLFFRLAVFPIEIPPLRERNDDVLLLSRHFAAQFGKELRKQAAILSDEAIDALQRHHWPGNVRELENAIERACILADSPQLEARDLGLNFGGAQARDSKTQSETLGALDLSGTLSEATDKVVRFVERQKIAEALRAHDNNKTRTAETLGVSYKTLLTKIKDYEL
ncbi:hypothetical protein BH18ACI2_BH18ACI2_15100 [soil metagenome]